MLETQRRFVVTDFNPEVFNYYVELNSKQQIRQFYLRSSEPHRHCRVQITDEEKAEMITEISVGHVQTGEAKPLGLEEACWLADKVCPGQLVKLRFTYQDWEIDFFLDPLPGLILMKFKSDQPLPALPPFINSVTEVPDTLTNLHLARLAEFLGGSKTPDLAALLSSLPRPRVKRIVLTGPACSGKSTIIKQLNEMDNPAIIVLPETASIIVPQIQSDSGPSKATGKLNQRQKTLVAAQKLFETTSIEQAQEEERRVIVLECGTPDIAARDPRGLQSFEQNCLISLREEGALYDQVFYLGPLPRNLYQAHCGNQPNQQITYRQMILHHCCLLNAWQVAAMDKLTFLDGDMPLDTKIDKIVSHICSAV